MANKRTKNRKSIIVRPTAKCGESENDFEGISNVTLPGGQRLAAERQAKSLALDEAQRRANAWIGSMTCPARCLLKSSSVETIDVESEFEFIKIGGRGYSLASARVVVKAKVRCDREPHREN